MLCISEQMQPLKSLQGVVTPLPRGGYLADLEFPIYYNFFIRKCKTRIVCTQSQAGRLVRALQEALFGPTELFLANDVLALSYFRDGVCTLGAVSIRCDQSGDFELDFAPCQPGIGLSLSCTPRLHSFTSSCFRGAHRPRSRLSPPACRPANPLFTPRKALRRMPLPPAQPIREPGRPAGP